MAETSKRIQLGRCTFQQFERMAEAAQRELTKTTETVGDSRYKFMEFAFRDGDGCILKCDNIHVWAIDYTEDN